MKLSALTQLATRASSRGLIHSCERLFDADSLTCKIISVADKASQFELTVTINQYDRSASLSQTQPVLICTGIVFDYAGSC